MRFEIEKARAEDADDVLRLVEANRLTTDGLLDHLASILVARLEYRIVGTAALEVHADGALLRSVAVSDDVRGCGLGTSLIQSALRMADDLGACDVYLLTFTAEQYFQRFGFRSLDRDEVPPSVRESVQFTRACPSNAVVMRKQLEKQRERIEAAIFTP
jgi:amino-acid N-acetyltransferase